MVIASKRVLPLLIAAALMFVLVGCGGGDQPADPNAGVYRAVTGEMMGIEVPVSDIWSGGFELELKDKGKCEIRIDGDSANGKWELSGSSFSMSGGGFDCTGTLEGGVLKLENVLDMGVDIVFHKDGYVPGAAAGQAGDEEAEQDFAAQEAPAAPAGSPLQDEWNGTWYGLMYVYTATGEFSGIADDTFDIYMIVDVDESGRGTLDVHLAGVDEAFASTACEARDTGLYATDGTIAGGVPINPNNWMFLPVPDYPEKYTITDAIGDGDSEFEFSLFVKPWGVSWQADIDSDFELLPPLVDEYEAAIAQGAQPPVGTAPKAYGGTGAAIAEQSAGDAAAPAESSGAPGFTGPTATYDYGEKGEIFFDYPSDTYSFERKFGVDTLNSGDGAVKISFLADWGLDDYAVRMEGYSRFVEENGGVLEEGLSYAGYDSTRVTWENAIGETNQETYILFGEGAGQYVGVNVTVTVDSKELLEQISADTEAILHSVRLNQE